MYRAIRSYLRARVRLLNAEAEKLSPSPLVMLTQAALPFLAGALHGYLQPTSASAGTVNGKVSPAEDPSEYPRGAYSVHTARGERPEPCPICKGTMVPGDVHKHTAETAEMWAKAPDWIHAERERVARERPSEKKPTPEEMAEEAQVRREEIEARGAPHEAATYKLGFEEGVRTERGRATMAQ